MHRFAKLPAWVRIMVTGRPQVEVEFSAWNPTWITPTDERNKSDMLELLRWRLEQKACVQLSDLDLAAQIMLDKSTVSGML